MIITLKLETKDIMFVTIDRSLFLFVLLQHYSLTPSKLVTSGIKLIDRKTKKKETTMKHFLSKTRNFQNQRPNDVSADKLTLKKTYP